MAVGILAYGSLITDPGKEIASAKKKVIERNVKTPFKIEFARKSQTRGNAPTLAPVRSGGARVKAKIIVLDDSIDVRVARDILWRRETRRVSSGESYPGWRKHAISIAMTSKAFARKYGLSAIIYTTPKVNIRKRSARILAKLAVESASDPKAAAAFMDGITYLNDAQHKWRIRTPLMAEYKREILRLKRLQTPGNRKQDNV